jgi:glycosyltransferase involved in cell wall biosynthesis
MGSEHVVSVIIPAYNEAGRVGLTVSAVWELPNVCEVIVVDDGSDDDTAREAFNAGASTVIRLPRRRGKGAALFEGVKVASGDVLLLVDADLCASARNLEPLIKHVLDGEADMAIAVPSKMGRGGFGIAKAFARLMIALTCGFFAKAPLCGQRAIKRQLVRRMRRFAGGFGVEVGLTIDAHMLGARIIEVPLDFEHRLTGRTLKGFLHRAKQLLDILRACLPRLLLKLFRGKRYTQHAMW